MQGLQKELPAVPKTLQVLADGSRLVEVRLAREKVDLPGQAGVMVREISWTRAAVRWGLERGAALDGL